MSDLFTRYPKLINLWPPLLGAGIRLKHIAKDFRSLTVEMRLTRLNRNYVGVHFGGSLFAMTDPFYMILLRQALGREYIVWDKAASIRFRRPGISTVSATFHLTDACLAEIRTALDRDGVHEPIFTVDVIDPEGNVIAAVERTLYCATKIAHKARLAQRAAKALQS